MAAYAGAAARRHDARAITATEVVRLREVLREFRALRRTPPARRHARHFGARLAGRARRLAAPRQSDLARFVRIALELGLERVGRAGDRFLAVGAYAGIIAGPLFPAGVWRSRGRPSTPRQYAKTSAMPGWQAPRHCLPRGRNPAAARRQGRRLHLVQGTRYGGEVIETGALARQLLAAQPLVGDLVATHGGGSVLARIVARMIEVARLLPQMEAWLHEIVPGSPFCIEWQAPEAATGVGLVEAARRARPLAAHRARQDRQLPDHRPDHLEFFPRDAAGQPGALEQALVGLPVADGDASPVLVQHVVRSFDPCMVCTVH